MRERKATQREERIRERKATQREERMRERKGRQPRWLCELKGVGEGGANTNDSKKAWPSFFIFIIQG
jgi:hypothetical protein